MTEPSPMMRRVVVSPGSVELITVPVPAPGPSEVLVEMTVSGVCGSDTHAARGRHPFVPLPYQPGHEVVGVVRAIGPQPSTPGASATHHPGAERSDGGRAMTVGQRVTVEPTLPCWHCKMCLSDRSNLCENLVFFGCGYAQGGMADFFSIPVNRLHAVPDDFDDLQAALIEPLSAPVHAARLAGDLRGKKVVILGCGTIGLLLLAAVRHFGVDRVVMTDPLQPKRALARRLGADVVVDAASAKGVGDVRSALGESADVVFDCVSVQATVTQAVQLALKGGTVMVVGVPGGEVSVPLHLIQDQQVRIQGSATYLPEDFDTSIAMIAAGEVRADDFVTGQFPLTMAAAAFASSASGTQVKVLVTAD